MAISGWSGGHMDCLIYRLSVKCISNKIFLTGLFIPEMKLLRVSQDDDGIYPPHSHIPTFPLSQKKILENSWKDGSVTQM